MNDETIFNIAGPIAIIGWIILILLPKWISSDKFIIGIIVTLFCIAYAWLIAGNFSPADVKKFNSLAGVMELFQNPALVVAGWIHYLAFDLMTGLFIKKNASKHGISHWLLIPCLFFTFMLGPAGLLLYLLLRFIITKNYFADNF